MTHTIHEKRKFLVRVRRMKGLIEAIEREAGCEKILHLIAGVMGATAGLMAEVVEEMCARISSMSKSIQARSMRTPPRNCSTWCAPI